MMNGNGNRTSDGANRRSVDEIRRDIDQTRHEMDETLDELYARLHPVHLLNDLLGIATEPRNRRRIRAAAARGRFKAERVRANATHQLYRAGYVARRTGRRVGQRASGFPGQLMHELRRHPVPALMVAAGVGLYLWRRSRVRPSVVDDMLEIDDDDYSWDGYGSAGENASGATWDRFRVAPGAREQSWRQIPPGRTHIDAERRGPPKDFQQESAMFPG